MHAGGLTVGDAPIAQNTRIRVAVAAGAGTGLSTGIVPTGLEAAIDVVPLGRVMHLVKLGVAVASGSSGAPVVDHSMTVGGFVVAGSTDPTRAESYMYPASQWREALKLS